MENIFMNKLLIAAVGILVMSSLYAKPMGQEEALEEAQDSCFWHNTACPLGADIAYKVNSSKKPTKIKIKEAIAQCHNDMDTDLRKISCLHGAQFFYSNLLGKQALKKTAMKTPPFIVYTSGHALGVSISLLNYMADSKSYKAASVENCELYSFDNDVLERCHQGLEAFDSIL
jgi:hypothetical protein